MEKNATKTIRRKILEPKFYLPSISTDSKTLECNMQKCMPYSTHEMLHMDVYCKWTSMPFLRTYHIHTWLPQVYSSKGLSSCLLFSLFCENAFFSPWNLSLELLKSLIHNKSQICLVTGWCGLREQFSFFLHVNCSHKLKLGRKKQWSYLNLLCEYFLK